MLPVGPIPRRYWRSLRTIWGCWLACDNTEMPACSRIWSLVMLTVSVATSTSWMRDWAAFRFSDPTDRLLMVCCKRFWMAPNDARASDTVLMAASMTLMADCAFACEVTSNPAYADACEMTV